MNTEPKTINAQTPGPAHVGSRTGHNACNIHVYNGKTVAQDTSIASVYGIPLHTTLEELLTLPKYAEGLATARLIAASYTAFDQAGRTLGVDAAELAEKIDLAALIREARAMGWIEF